ncbi:MAG: DotU family type IV/VI secretion system protein [Polaromonas sp.]|uniref:DotU family type IV/VI secretion system protein n=1 Tax=Polaromonas sp. TaxID=1869339 RepID=UPI0025D88B5E|nr:DotU family type IV/VI secretion system protein [Polaromonas sp.]MBI2727067.1 DotU family type IV/VI secretion system protein [Polaromonas sp.]
MHLIDCFIAPLAFLRQFQIQPSGDLASVRQQLDELIAQSRNAASDAGMSDTDTEDALFAVLAWADEVLLATPWAGAGEWARHLLQRRYFNVTNAGDAFFKRLEVLDARQMQVREVYFYCLSLGFAGRYGYDRNAKALSDVRQATLQPMLRDIRAQREGLGLTSEMEKLMFPDGYAHLHAAEGDAGSKPASRWDWKFSSLTFNVLLVPLIILAVLYGVYHIIIWQMVNSLMAQIK